jgi:TonB family protein
MSDPDARHRRALVASLLLHATIVLLAMIPLADQAILPPDPLEVALLPPPLKKPAGGSPVPAAAPALQVPALAPPVQLSRISPVRPLRTVAPPVAVRAQAPVASGVGQGGQGTGIGRGIGAGSEDDYVERLRRHFNARSRSVEAPYDAPRYIQVRVVALIDQTGLLLRAEIQDGSGYGRVDRAVLDQLRDMSPFPPPPPELHPPFRITMPLAFQTDRS